MKKKSPSKSAFFNPRILAGFVLCSAGAFLAFFAFGALPGGGTRGAQPGTQRPDIMRLMGPVSQDQDLRNLPYIPANEEQEERRLTRRPFPLPGPFQANDVSDPIQSMIKSAFSVNIPSPLLTFAGMGSSDGGCGSCTPPDSDGDVGPNHYIESVNSSIRIHDKSGNVIAGPITYNSFFAALGSATPCGAGQNGGDGIAFYDHIADRWVVSDFAFSFSTTTGPYYQCIGISK